MAEESRPILMQQPARQYTSRQVPRQPLTHQQPIMPQKRRLPEQPWEGRHRSKRKRRERRAPQAGASGWKRRADELADRPPSKAARTRAETRPRSQDSQAPMPRLKVRFTMGLQPRKAEPTQPGCNVRKAKKSLNDMKQGALKIPAPHFATAAWW